MQVQCPTRYCEWDNKFFYFVRILVMTDDVRYWELLAVLSQGRRRN